MLWEWTKLLCGSSHCCTVHAHVLLLCVLHDNLISCVTLSHILIYGGTIMSLDDALRESISQVPECIAGAYVDMSTGLLLSVYTISNHPQEILDVLSASTADLFQGSSTVAIEKMWKRVRNQPDEGGHYFKEIIVMSNNHIHVFLRCTHNSDHAVVYVTRKTANIGMVIAKSRMTIPPLEASL